MREKWFPLETERLLLREFSAGDEPDVHEYGSDPDVTQFVEWGPNTPEESHAVVLDWLDAQRTWPRAEVTLAVELKSERKVIGGFRLAVRTEDGSADLGYAFNRRYWNKGYATEAARAVLAAAFSVLGLQRVWATCDARNAGSRRVLEKAGMRREAHRPRDVWQKGEWRDSYVYAVHAEEFGR